VLPLPVLDKIVTTGDPGKEIFEFAPPAGYTVDEVVDARISYWGGGEPLLNISDPSWMSQPPLSKHSGSGPGDGWYETKIHAFGSPLKREITVLCGAGTILTVSMQATARRTPEAFDSWRRRTWTALHDAAVARHNEAISRLQDERDKLWRLLAGKDTLSLRRLEREELLRLILLWLIGPAGWYSNAPAAVEQAVQQLLSNEQHLLAGAPPPPAGSPTFSGVGSSAWSQALAFGELVKFLMQAVEWENLLYFLYPYFWGSEQQGRDRLLFEHPDPEHQNFLRAGYARVVLTVRPGFEEDLLRLIETGSLTGTYSSPYMPIAQEIAARARTNYAGVPPANPERHARPLLYPQQRHTWDTMQQVISALETYAAAHSGAYPATLADLPGGAPPTDAWGNELVYVVPGSGNEYDLISYGADGKEGGEDLDADISAAAGASLVASWLDYTPTSGLDIQLDTKPGDFA
jgi:Type II secretion system (T2SS), protein G